MLRETTKTNYFAYKKEEEQNPYIGFCSFQHFRGEKLYSDIVVKPENNMCETEDVECYPIPEWVPENGRDEGYYPDTSIVYIRILWKEFEPEQGKYNYQFVQDILDTAKAHNQTVAFRLMAHSTRDIDDVPDWLKEIIPCPARPKGKRVKDSPTDPKFLQYFTKAVRAFGEKFDSNPVLDTMDISLPGSWGEGHNLELYPEEDIENLFDMHTEVFKETRLIGQLTKPGIAKRASKVVPVGLRGDGLGNPYHLHEVYGKQLEQFPDAWKSAPISFEAFWWLCEWQRKGWDIDEVIQMTLGWHISSFNAKSIPIPFEWKDKIDYWVSKMGYHYVIDYFKFPGEVEAGDEITLKLGIDNVGVAPIYRKLPLHIRLIDGEKEYPLENDVDITKWMPGKNAEKATFVLPENMKKGTYAIEIGIFNQDIPVVYFASDAKRSGAYYKVGEITVK